MDCGATRHNRSSALDRSALVKEDWPAISPHIQEFIIFRRFALGLLSIALAAMALQGSAAGAVQHPAHASPASSSAATLAHARTTTSKTKAAQAKSKKAKARAKARALATARAAAKARAASQAPSTSLRTKHFVTNLHGSKAPAGLGFDLFDISASTWALGELPAGVQGLVYLGQKCPTPADAAFRSTVDRLAKSSKVFGYYLSDEPHIKDCANGPQALATRADYIRKVTSGAQKSFIVLSKTEDYVPFRPAVTHVDLVGLDSYPCSIANPTCDPYKVAEKVDAAKAAGIPLNTIVPVFQAFGQSGLGSSHYYNLPTTTQMTALLAAWDKAVPNPVMDYTYSWGNQGSSNPTLVDSPGLQHLFKQRFAG